MNDFTRSLQQGMLSDLRKYKHGGNAIFCLAFKLVSVINALLKVRMKMEYCMSAVTDSTMTGPS